jgi:hypothetical protein
MSVNVKRDKFDFEIGYFVESPCKHCENRKNFPGCENECLILDEIHQALASGVSCTYSSSK